MIALLQLTYQRYQGVLLCRYLIKILPLLRRHAIKLAVFSPTRRDFSLILQILGSSSEVCQRCIQLLNACVAIHLIHIAHTMHYLRKRVLPKEARLKASANIILQTSTDLSKCHTNSRPRRRLRSWIGNADRGQHNTSRKRDQTSRCPSMHTSNHNKHSSVFDSSVVVEVYGANLAMTLCPLRIGGD